MKQGYMYILASKRNGTLYVGVTSSLFKRIYEHRNSFVRGFTQKYGVYNLVYFEVFEDIENAIVREKQIKNWKRSWKIELIEQENPCWDDLYEELFV